MNKALDALAAIDPDIAAALEQLGHPEPRPQRGGFDAFAGIITAQQIAAPAAAAIRARLAALVVPMDAATFLATPPDAIRACGLSARKAAYITGIAEAFVDGRLEEAALAALPDAELVKQLTALNGIGLWSAEIYMLFALRRPDVFPAGDYALRVALGRLKNLPDMPDEKQARSLTQAWSPHRSAGACFLWHYHHGNPA